MFEAETSEQRGHHEKPTEDIVDRRLSQQDGTVTSGIPAQTNQAVTDHKGDLDGPNDIKMWFTKISSFDFGITYDSGGILRCRLTANTRTSAS